MTSGTGTMHVMDLSIHFVVRMHARWVFGLLGAGTATAPARRAGATFGAERNSLVGSRGSWVGTPVLRSHVFKARMQCAGGPI